MSKVCEQISSWTTAHEQVKKSENEKGSKWVSKKMSKWTGESPSSNVPRSAACPIRKQKVEPYIVWMADSTAYVWSFSLLLQRPKALPTYDQIQRKQTHLKSKASNCSNGYVPFWLLLGTMCKSFTQDHCIAIRPSHWQIPGGPKMAHAALSRQAINR